MSPGLGPSLAERSAASAAPSADPRSGPPRHCWVLDAPIAGLRCPGLLVEWRRGVAGWEGRVVYGVSEGGRPVLVEEWVPARRLESAG